MRHRSSNQHDQIMHGAIPGAIAGAVQSVYGYALKNLHVTDRIFMDYGAVLILGHSPGKGISIIGLIAHILNAAMFGIVFGYIMKHSTKRYYVIKGIGLGIFIWGMSLGIGTLYKLPLFFIVPYRAAYVMLGGALIWGIAMSLIYRYIDQKQNAASTVKREQRNKHYIFRVLPLPAKRIHHDEEKKVRFKKPIRLR